MSIGDNEFGQQCNGTEEDIQHIQKIKTLQKKVTNVVVGGEGAVYLLYHDGTTECAGYNDWGQLAECNELRVNRWTMNKNLIIKTIFAPSFASYQFFALSMEDKIYAVGGNYYNQFGIKTKEQNNNKWTLIEVPATIQKIATSSSYTTFLSGNGQIYVAGESEEGGLGLGHDIIESPKLMTMIKTKTKFQDVRCGEDYTDGQ